MGRTRTRGSHSVPHPPGTASSRLSSSTAASDGAPRATVGAATLPNIGKSAENQDTFGACNVGSSKNFVGVFDGHGEMGHHISRIACDSLQRNLFNNSKVMSDPRSALDKAYRDTQSQIMNDHGEDAMYSGTTAVAAYQNKHQLLVANVGDSRAVIGRCNTGASRSSQCSLRAVDLSSDHKPDRLDERNRIEKHGGRVGQSLFPVENLLGGVSFVRAGPARVLAADGVSGLAMSRSLGDANYHPHVIAKPEIHERHLDSRDKVLILGSDGVWDQMTSQEAVSIARRHKDPNAAAKQIADISKRRWMAETGNALSDDITAVVMRLDHHGGGRSTGPRSERSITAKTPSDRSSMHRSTNSRMDSLLNPGHPSSTQVPSNREWKMSGSALAAGRRF